MSLDIVKKPDETLGSFVYRLASQKTLLNLSWDDIRDICNAQFSIHCSESYYRKGFASGKFSPDEKLTDVGYTSNMMFKASPLETYTGDDASELEQECAVYNNMLAQEEKFKKRKERESLNRMYKSLYAFDIYDEIAKNVCNELKNKYYTFLNTNSSPDIQSSQEKAILCISDWHYGVNIDNFTNTFNEDVCIARVHKLFQDTLAILKKEKITELYLCNLGDLIAGRIHTTLRIESTQGVINQILSVTDILVAFIDSFIKSGIRVHYYWCLDNHSRVEPDKEKSLKDENLVYVQNKILSIAFKDNPNFIFNQNTYGDDIISFNCDGFNVGGCHGDLDKQKNAVKNLSLFTHKVYDIVLSAHMHHFSADELCGSLLVCNGTLMGTDSYASNLRVSSTPSQNLIIVNKVAGNVAESIHRIILN